MIPFADEIGEEYSPSVSPDDKRITYIWDGNSHQPNVYIKDVDGVTRTQVTQGDARCFSPAWSPDGLSLAYLRLTGADLSVLVRDLRSGHEREITRVRHETGLWSSDNGPLLGDVGPVWSQDGQSLFVADRLFEDAGVGGIYRIDIRTGSRDQITSAPGETRDFSPRISPNGRTLAFVRYFSHGHGELFTAPSSGGKVVRLTADNRDIQGPTWSRDGMSLIFSSNRSGYFQLWSLGLQGGSPLLLSTNTTSATAPFAFHRSDALAFVDAAENWNIWSMSIRDGRT